MTKKWNLQDISPNEARRKTPSKTVDKRTVPAREETVREAPKRSAQPPRKSSKKKRGWYKIIALVLLLGIIGFGSTFFFRGAEITLYPKNKEVTVEADFTAYTEPSAGQLGYEMLVLEADGERQVTASGQEEVEEHAVGSLTVYNEYSEKPIRLVKNTRFESPDGLIFRATESVVVPGYTTDEEGNKAPGTITAKVFADSTGEEYNIDPTDFTIPGFEGEPEFDGVYAKSTEAFTGGFEGAKFIIGEEELKTAEGSLHEELRDALRSRLETERPAGFVLYDDAVTFTFEELPSTDNGDGNATLKERGRLQVPLFNGEQFASYIAENTVAGYEGEDVALADPNTLSFAYTASSTAMSNLADENEVSFKLSGTAKLVWQFDEEMLKKDIAGLAKSALPTVLSGYTAVEKAEATIRPFWKQSFPDDPEDIGLNIVLE